MLGPPTAMPPRNRSTTTPSRTRGAFPFTPPRSVSVVPPHLVAGAVLHELCCWRHRIGIPLPARMFGLAVPGGKMFLQATAVSAQPHAQAHRSAVARLLAACDFEFAAKRRYRGGRSGMHRLHVVTAPSLLASLATTSVWRGALSLDRCAHHCRAHAARWVREAMATGTLASQRASSARRLAG